MRTTIRSLFLCLIASFSVMPQPATAPVGCDCASSEATAANRAALEAHRRRSLNEASASYTRALELAPARALTAEERALVFRFAPMLRITANEPFVLKDVVAILHPVKPWIGYHLFWEDDIDFPDDNDPCDHEVIWIQLDERREQLVGYATYFHGRVLVAPPASIAQARRNGMRPVVNVQWGKHGSMPFDWRELTIVADAGDAEDGFYPAGRPITLETYNRGTYDKLRTKGRRAQDSPLGRDWPKMFTGTWDDFIGFSRRVDLVVLLRRKQFFEVTCFANATINRHFLTYNFSAKTEWPEAWCAANGRSR